MKEMNSFPFPFSLCKYLDKFSSLHIMVYGRETYPIWRKIWSSGKQISWETDHLPPNGENQDCGS